MWGKEKAIFNTRCWPDTISWTLVLLGGYMVLTAMSWWSPRTKYSDGASTSDKAALIMMDQYRKTRPIPKCLDMNIGQTTKPQK